MKIDSEKASLALEREILSMDGKIMHPVIVSNITNAKEANLPLKSLDRILSNSEEEKKYSVFRTRFSTMAILPKISTSEFKPD